MTGRKAGPKMQEPGIPESVRDLVKVLRAILTISSRDEKLLKRATSITIQYELLEGEGVYPYYCRSDGAHWELAPGSLPEEECDIIVRTFAEDLTEILQGGLSGREAIASGKMSLRKAPSMPMLLVMRAMYNRYAKAQTAGRLSPGAQGKP